MPEPDKNILLSEVIHRAFSAPEGKVRVGDILNEAATKGFGLILVFVSLPVAVPATPPGVSAPFGILTVLLAFQLLFRRPSPWVPSWIENRELKATAKHGKFLAMMEKFVLFFERFLKTRWTVWSSGRLFLPLVVPSLLLTGVVMISPLPIINSLSSLAALLIGLSMLEDDGVFALAGVIVSIVTAVLLGVFVVALIQHGPAGIGMVADGIKSVFRR